MIFVKKIPSSKDELASRIDHTLLKPDAPLSKYIEEWKKASMYGFRAFVAPLTIIEMLQEGGSFELPPVRLATVIGFPNGYTTVESKLAEIKRAAEVGVSDVDFVPNLVMVKSGLWEHVDYEINKIIKEAKNSGLVTKIILETGYLAKDELNKLASIAIKRGVDYLKTSTGFGPRGATVDDIIALREISGRKAGIKASGGIRTAIQAALFIGLGADIIGTSSGVSIVEGFSSEIVSLFKSS